MTENHWDVSHLAAGDELHVQVMKEGGRPYNMLEIYHPDGRLEELYVHVAGPPTLVEHLITWTDYELDVVLHPGGTPEILDEGEFAEAALAYGYSAEFRARCYEIARDLAGLLSGWTPAPPPATNS